MKIRSGFVSNSSSSSFLIYGVRGDAKDFGVEDSEELYDKVKGLEINTPPYDDIYVGLSWGSMDDDETKRQFMNRVETQIKEAFPDKFSDERFGSHEASWYDG